VPGVTLLKALHDAERMKVMVKAQAVALQADIECTLTGVAKGRMADVMHERERLGEVYVEAKRCGNLACYLRDLNGVREAAAKVVRGTAGEDLRLAREAAEGTRLNDAIAVAFKVRSAVGGRRRKLTG
jgi:hypothetical protein